MRRVRKIKALPYQSGSVLYWMNRDMRIADNWALHYAALFAETKGVGLEIVYNLDPTFLGGRGRQLEFKIEGLQSAKHKAQEHGWMFHVLDGIDTVNTLKNYIFEQGIGVVITDFSPLRIQQQWLHNLANEIEIPIFQVDAHNIVPVWVASSKQEFGAYTLRPKIQRQLSDFLVEFPPYPDVTSNRKEKINVVDYIPLFEKDHLLTQPLPNAGEEAGIDAAHIFISKHLPEYHLLRNDPSLHATSHLSPYLHYGMLSAQRLALMVKSSDAPSEAKEAFLEELIVRRELSDNFCFYNPAYDTPEGFPTWAKKTLEEHKDDPKQYLYSREEFEHPQTHDPLWNAAQKQMLKTGMMHGYMRMYWAKKIFEWSPSVEKAMEIAIYLNDAYQLDGRDPNGYVGIAWSMGGVHDRAWFERDIYGKIRYMNANGCKAKFDVEKYISWVDQL